MRAKSTAKNIKVKTKINQNTYSDRVLPINTREENKNEVFNTNNHINSNDQNGSTKEKFQPLASDWLPWF